MVIVRVGRSMNTFELQVFRTWNRISVIVRPHRMIRPARRYSAQIV